MVGPRSPIFKYFSFSHLPLPLQDVAQPVAILADMVERILPEGPEKSAGLRKLLEAKDCFVRAKLDQLPFEGPRRPIDESSTKGRG